MTRIALITFADGDAEQYNEVTELEYRPIEDVALLSFRYNDNGESRSFCMFNFDLRSAEFVEIR